MEKILIIDDEKEGLENLKDILKLDGYEVITANSGVEGIELAIQENPDLIISDLNMPEMDGFEVFEIMKSDPATFSIPFLFLTAEYKPENIRTGMQLGADDFLEKPFKAKDLLYSVRTRLDKFTTYKSFFDKKIKQLQYTISYSFPHELRTPLNSIMGFAQLIESSIDDLNKDDIRLMSGRIYESGKRLMTLITRFTTYTKLQSILAEEFNIEEKQMLFPDTLITDLAENIAKNYNRLDDIEVSFDDNPLRIDSEHLQALSEELIDNSFKFSKAGEKVEITGKRFGEKYHLTFLDNGKGINTKTLSEIEAFSQFERWENEQQGIGIGFSMVKKIVELYEGELKIESEIEKLTKITIIL